MTENTKSKLPQFVDQNELAEALGLSVRTIEDWRQTHNGPPYNRFGRSIRYDVDEVREFLTATKQDKKHV